MLQRSDQQRSKGIVNDKDNAVLVGDFRHALDVQDIAVGITKRLCKDDFRVRQNGCFESSKIVDFYDGMGNS